MAHAFNCGTVIAGSLASAFLQAVWCVRKRRLQHDVEIRKNKVLNYLQRTAL